MTRVVGPRRPGLIGDTQVSSTASTRRRSAGSTTSRGRTARPTRRCGSSGDGAIVKQSFAKKNGLEVGDPFRCDHRPGKRIVLRVVGIYQPPRFAELMGGVDRHRTRSTGVPAPAERVHAARGDPTTAGLQKALAAFPDTKVQTSAEFVKNQTSFMSSLLNLLYVLLALSVVVSLFGMINTLVLSVFERTREIGMLRAVGMSRRQARRMIRHESVITALIGAASGCRSASSSRPR